MGEVCRQKNNRIGKRYIKSYKPNHSVWQCHRVYLDPMT